jgi:hypothetical protein
MHAGVAARVVIPHKTQTVEGYGYPTCCVNFETRSRLQIVQSVEDRPDAGNDSLLDRSYHCSQETSDIKEAHALETCCRPEKPKNKSLGTELRTKEFEAGHGS